MSRPVVVGAVAPDFTAKDQHNQLVSLADTLRDRAVVLVFFPFAFSPICTGELGVVRENLAAYRDAGVQVIPMSVDHPYALKAWVAAEGFDFGVLSDFWPHGAIARQYGVFDEQRGMAMRGTFGIDRGGIIRFAEVNKPGVARDPALFGRAIAKL